MRWSKKKVAILSSVFGDVEETRFTTVLVSLLEGKKVLLINVGDWDTFIYCPVEGIEAVKTCGFLIGMFTPEEIMLSHQFYEEIERDVLSGFTLVSYPDGINERKSFDNNEVKRIIIGNLGNISSTIDKIFDYADKLDKGLDDSTVIGLYIK